MIVLIHLSIYFLNHFFHSQGAGPSQLSLGVRWRAPRTGRQSIAEDAHGETHSPSRSHSHLIYNHIACMTVAPWEECCSPTLTEHANSTKKVESNPELRD